MVNSKAESDRKSVQLNVSISPYLKKRLDELVEKGLFSNISDAVRWAIAKMIADLEVQGYIEPSKKPDDMIIYREEGEIR